MKLVKVRDTDVVVVLTPTEADALLRGCRAVGLSPEPLTLKDKAALNPLDAKAAGRAVLKLRNVTEG